MSITTKFIPHSLIGIVSVLPALLVMPAMGEDVSSASELNTALQTGADIVVTGDILDVDSVVTVSGKTNSIDLGGKTLAGVNDATTGYVFSGGSLTLTGGGTISGLSHIDNTTPSKLNGDEFGALNASGTGITITGGEWNFSGNTAAAGAINVSDAIFDATVDTIAFENNVSNVQGAGFRHDAYSTNDTYARITANEIRFAGNHFTDDATVGSGAGAMNSRATMELLGNVNTFEDNHMNADVLARRHYKVGGGAVANQSGYNESTSTAKDATMVIGKDANSINTFTGNTSSTSGGAIMNRAVDEDGDAIMTINGTSSFTNNEAAKKGGAIYNVAMGLEVEDPETANGLTLARRNTLTLADSSTFDGNKAGESGGAIYNSGDMTINNATFVNNRTTTDYVGYYASRGGAIYNSGVDDLGSDFTSGGVLTINGATFGDKNDATKGNSAIVGGAIANSADEWGSGEFYESLGTITLNNTNFYYNKARADSDASDGYFTSAGGAIWNDDGIINVNGDTEFIGNNAEGFVAMGGAIRNGYGEITFNDSVTFDSNISNKTIAGNGAQGGAIDNNGLISFTKLANFQGNEAVNTIAGPRANLTCLSKGGAIYNETYGVPATITFEKDAIFEANKADLGGAVFNMDGTVVFTESTMFTNNVANFDGGAIFNLDEMTFAGTNTFSGNTANGVANDIYNAGTLTFAAGSATTIDGGITGTGALTIDSGAILNLGNVSIAQNTFTLNGVVNGELTDTTKFATFDVTEEFSGDGSLNLTLKAAGTYKVFANRVFNNANVHVADSAVFTYDWNDAGDTVTVSTKSANEIIEAIDNVDATAVNAVVALANNDDATAQQIGNALAAALANGDTGVVEQEVKKLAPAEKPVTHSVAASVQSQVLTLTANRMSGGVIGRAGGDEVDADYGVWAQGLYNKSRFLGEFDGKSRGVAVGFDALVNKIYTLGVGYSFTGSDIDMNDGGKIDIDSHTVFVYGQYKPSNWFINATISDTQSQYTEKAIVLGTPAKTDYDVNSFGIQAMTGYDFASGITPMVGMRYLHVSTDGHNRLLGYVDDSQSSFLSAVGGLKYAFDIQDTGYVRWTPELHALATYDVIADKNGATVYVPGGTIYHVAGDRMSRGGGELGMGLTAEWRGLELSLNYDLQLRKDYLSHTGMIKLRYEF